ncbi:hypothetical protein P7K49_005910 [Saguinus oedipus]|uniref:Uncharacterized protein n=1 Tax=Saguinus oedipus TaxID=9490 RepID=A0ABQ9W2K0_SAGOE|nr:hypothetical protein P7K49_005910 [Saguinus oedipus]
MVHNGLAERTRAPPTDEAAEACIVCLALLFSDRSAPLSMAHLGPAILKQPMKNTEFPPASGLCSGSSRAGGCQGVWLTDGH